MVDLAEISLWGEPVGAVRWLADQNYASFQYHPDFIKKGWDLSPIKMPLKQGAVVHSFPELRRPRSADEDTFKGLPGLLADALPDRYGNRLMDVWLVRNGRQPGSMNPVEQLCFMGTRAMGALEFKPVIHPKQEKQNDLELGGLVEIAKKVLDQREQFQTTVNKEEEEMIKDLLKIGTSAGGARPKAVIAFNPKTGAIKSGQGTPTPGFEHWMIKLDGVSAVQLGTSKGWGRVEYAYHLMAKDCGIDMMPCSLLEENGRAHFLTQRFDRDPEGHKFHVQTFCALQHFDYNDMLSFSYEQLFQTMRQLRLKYGDAEQMYRRMVFNVLASNCDDHTKNFGFILKPDGVWRLAPAYDLCFAYNPTNFWVNQQTLSVRGKRQGISKGDLLEIANENSIKKGKEIIELVEGVVQQWSAYAKEVELDSELSKTIEKRNKHILKNI
ncbi:type II toxin-antitoxin system HipA family toxin [Luteibaculum oceani]|uniref:Type II toxin-antitoxin system HipA family toxin n=1 Tax=Luteibaculum oceani TaxID=1294296 RepID=A0A5C6UYL0_9FLAO|nr:type II toxin-antitoxin system HipA family toxin [Luteibaculum oceani]TXC76048.1 type II toxin-antitoxin system HipA family toxin [Luteibaculum oceani]